jgi:peptidoglycan/xylan/chitin deacetylase (PgdA/CDA1 family)
MLTLALAALLASPPAPDLTVAITLDDLPGVGAGSLNELVEMNRRVLAALQAAKAPAIGFVNEGSLHVDGERDQRVALLAGWLEAGMTLGNHGFAHLDLSKVPPAQYQDDVIRGEVITRRLLNNRQLPLVYFRHPYTHTGPTPEVKQQLERFLAERKYRIAPHTIENSDWMFSAVYARALDRGDRAQAASIRASYLAHLQQVCAWFEALARDSFGRDIPQVLLAHVNRLNADALPDVLALLRKRGYRFVTLDQALVDEAYRTPDEYVGRNGPSWLHRWRVAKQLPPRLPDEPDVPPDIQALAKAGRPPPAGEQTRAVKAATTPRGP